MKKINIFLLVLPCILFYCLQLFADEICTFAIKDCPEAFNNSTIYVPTKVNQMSPNFNVCVPIQTIEDIIAVGIPPSVFFVIDNSNSMLGHQIDEPRDLGGSRFLVTKALIDTLYNAFPDAEVGLAVFRNRLVFDVNDDPIFVPLPATVSSIDPTRGYIPLLKLDSTLANGMTGAEYLKMRLETNKVEVTPRGRDKLIATTLAYDKDLSGGTNINAPFDAARAAMANARYPREDQFVIFLSDGEANTPSGNFNEYMNGVGMPTTFTIFFTPGANGVAPPNIVTMTDNIKTNNYSFRNPESNLWTIQTSFETLMNVMMERIIQPMLHTVRQTPQKLIINQKTYQANPNSVASFYLADDYMLKGDKSHFDVEIQYKVASSLAAYVNDTTIRVAFDVVRTDSREPSKGILIDCRDTIYYQVSIKAKDTDASEENANPGTFEFSRANAKGAVTVYYSIQGTALNGVDYLKIADSLVFLDGEKTFTTTITPLEDLIKEGDETVKISIETQRRNKEIRYIPGKESTATLTIRDHYIVPEEPDSFGIVITPNPFSTKKDLSTGDERNLINNYYKDVIGSNNLGSLIAITSTRGLIPLTENVYGTGFIYDAVGNLVKNIEIKKVNPRDSTFFGAVWDGTNNVNRKVGIGTYLIKMKVKSTTGIERVFNRKIGIKE